MPGHDRRPRTAVESACTPNAHAPPRASRRRSSEWTSRPRAARRSSRPSGSLRSARATPSARRCPPGASTSRARRTSSRRSSGARATTGCPRRCRARMRPRGRRRRHSSRTARCDLLAGFGLFECATYSFVSEAENAPFASAAPGAPVLIENALGEPFTTMRATPVIGLLQSARHNARRGQMDLALFEVGTSFGWNPDATDEQRRKRGNAERVLERRRVGILLAGRRRRHWSETSEEADFFEGAGIAAALFRASACGPVPLSPSRRIFLRSLPPGEIGPRARRGVSRPAGSGFSSPRSPRRGI